MDLKGHRLILASGSPRRSELLNKAQIPFSVRVKEVEENFPSSLHYSHVAEYLAEKKAVAQKDLLENDEFILAADTIVVFEDKIYGKPNSREDAIQTLLKLSGQIHQVFTGVCLLGSQTKHSFTEESLVKFGHISENEVEFYFDTFNPSDKAGSYGIQDWIGWTKIEWIKGSYSNILGMPLAQTYAAIQSFVEND